MLIMTNTIYLSSKMLH